MEETITQSNQPTSDTSLDALNAKALAAGLDPIDPNEAGLGLQAIKAAAKKPKASGGFGTRQPLDERDLANIAETDAKAAKKKAKKSKKDDYVSTADLDYWRKIWRLKDEDRWYIEVEPNRWQVANNRTTLNTYLVSLGLFNMEFDAKFVADLHVSIDMEHTIDGELEHPFYPRGLIELMGKRYFNGSTYDPVMPVPRGSLDEKMIAHELGFIFELMGSNIEQYERLLDALQLVYHKAFYKKGGKNIPPVILASEADTGKSALSILIQCLLKTAGNAKNWLYGRDKYNANLFMNPFIVADDGEFLKLKGNSGEAQGNLKSLAASPTQEWRGMFCAGENLPWGGLCLVTVNTNVVRGLVEATADITDKLLVFQCADGARNYRDHLDTQIAKHNGSIEDYFTKDVCPHLASFLLTRTIKRPGKRFNLSAYIHPELMKIIGIVSNASEATELIDLYWSGNHCDNTVRVSASKFLETIEMMSPRVAKAYNLKSIGAMLTWLSDNGRKDVCARQVSGNNVVYLLTRQTEPEPDPAPFVEAETVAPPTPAIVTSTSHALPAQPVTAVDYLLPHTTGKRDGISTWEPDAEAKARIALMDKLARELPGIR